MTAAVTDTTPPFPGRPVDNREFRRFAAGLGIVYVVATLAIFAKLLVFPATAGSAPATAGAACIASDITAIHADPSGVADFAMGSGYLEFNPPPAGPRSTLGFSPASTTEPAHESGKPADAQHGRVVADTQEF